MTEFVKKLKEQINIVDVIGEFVRLKKTGTNSMGLCPFHSERSPSFSVSEKKGIYYCFGCQKGGDVISFIQEIQTVSFKEAVRILCAKINVSLPLEFCSRGRSTEESVSSINKSQLDIYYKLNRFAAQFYHEKLLSPQGKEAREYLVSRGIQESTIKKAYLGFAPNGWASLYEFLNAKRAPIDKACELGLIRPKEAPSYDRAYYDLFRNRILFPITDNRGRVIAFGGRTLEKNEGGPKYLNSQESPIYKKGSHVYGLFQAQKEIRAEDTCIVVEGFLDCLCLQQAGLGYVVATLGTALTQPQVLLLKRLAQNVVIIFDGDAAGQAAQIRAMEIFLNEDVVARGISLPDGLDPDDYVKKYGVATLIEKVKTAPFLLDQHILELASRAGSHAEARVRAVEKILPWISKMNADTTRLVRTDELAHLFGVQSRVISQRVNELRAQNHKENKQKRMVGKIPNILYKQQNRPMDPLDTRLIEMLIICPALASFIEANPEGILNGLQAESARALISQFINRANRSEMDAEILQWPEAVPFKSVITAALIKENQEQPNEELLKEFNDLSTRLVRRNMERQRENLRATLLKAEGGDNATEVSKLMEKYHQLVKDLGGNTNT